MDAWAQIRRRRISSRAATLVRSFTGLSLQQHDQETQDDVRGPVGLTLLFAPSEPVVDFIFVHGLRGGSRKTWSKSDDPYHFWIKEWLPRDSDFRSVRIHSFGYNADWAERGDSILNIQDYAKSLLGCMQDSRPIKNDANLPIVFIGHSMGRLVIKKAHILAQQDPAFQKLGKRFHSIFFLATPHRGSDSAQLLTYLLSVSRGARPYLLELQRNSQSTQSINDEFYRYSKDLRLYSFYETQATNFGVNSTLIVDKDSAVLGYDNERSELLNANHRGICKFDTPYDSNFVRLRSCFVSVVDEIMNDWSLSKLEIHRDQKRRLESFLGVSGKPEDDLMNLENARMDGSCEWLIRKDNFRRWRDLAKGSAKIFWLTAKPGTGKSVLAGFVINHLEDINLDCSYYFFNHGNKGKSILSSFLRSIAYQMALLNPSVRENLLAMQQDGVQIDKDNYYFIWRKVFVGAIFPAKFHQPQYWIIDALDECQNYTDFISMIAKIEETFPLRILITSRPDLNMKNRSLHINNVEFEEILLEDTMDDIKLYMESNISLQLGEDSDYEELMTTILQKSVGCFLWVKLVLEELGKVYSSADIREVLHAVPTGMDSLYNRSVEMMSTAQYGKPLAKAILTWTMCSARPLTTDELRHALLMDINDTVHNLERSIPSICGQLVFVDSKSQVQMVHQTARDFLLGLDDKSSEFAINVEDGHRRLAETCLRYLTSAEMRAPRNRKLGAPPPTKRSPFLDYACTSFYEHINAASSAADSLMILLGEFLRSSNVLSWIDYVAQSGNLNHLIRTGKVFKTYLERRQKYASPLGKDVQTVDAWGGDLIRLVARFGTNLLDLPSSIYWLIPPFCPLESAPYRQFGVSTRGIAVKGLSATAWDDRLSSIIYRSERPSAVACGDNSFVVGMSDGTILVYHLMTCQEMRALQHKEVVKVLEFSPSSKLLASGGRGIVCVWNVSSGAQLWRFETLNQPLALVFTEDDKVLMSAMRDNQLAYWNITEGTTTRICPWYDEKDGEPLKPNRPPTAIAFSLELNLLAINYRGRLILWDLENDAFFGFCGKENDVLPGKKGTTTSIMDLVFSSAPNTSLLAAAYQDGDLALFDPLEGTIKELIFADAQTLASSPDGRTLASGDASGTIQLFDFETFRLMYRLKSWDDGIKALAFSSDSLRFIDIRGPQCNVWGPSVLVRQDANDEKSETLSTAPKEIQVADSDDIVMITTIVCHPTAGCVFCGRDDGSVTVYETDTGNKSQSIYSHRNGISVTFLAFDEKSDFIASVDSSSKMLTYRLAKRAGKWETEGPFIDRRIEQAVSQLIFNNKPPRLLISSPTSHSLWTIDGEHISTILYAPRTAWRWVNNPINTEELIFMADGSAHVYAWEDFGELTGSNGIPLDYELPDAGIKAIVPCCNGTIFATELYQPRGNQSTQRLFLWKASSFDADAVSAFPLKKFLCLATRAEYIIGALGSKLVFLDSAGWVCSVDLVAFTGEFYLRHFFLPSDWLNTSNNLLFQVTLKGDVIFAKRDEIAVIKRGFDHAEAVALGLGSGPGSDRILETKAHTKV